MPYLHSSLLDCLFPLLSPRLTTSSSLLDSLSPLNSRRLPISTPLSSTAYLHSSLLGSLSPLFFYSLYLNSHLLPISTPLSSTPYPHSPRLPIFTSLVSPLLLVYHQHICISPCLLPVICLASPWSTVVSLSLIFSRHSDHLSYKVSRITSLNISRTTSRNTFCSPSRSTSTLTSRTLPRTSRNTSRSTLPPLSSLFLARYPYLPISTSLAIHSSKIPLPSLPLPYPLHPIPSTLVLIPHPPYNHPITTVTNSYTSSPSALLYPTPTTPRCTFANHSIEADLTATSRRDLTTVTPSPPAVMWPSKSRV